MTTDCNKYITYRKYNNIFDAQPLVNILEENNIDYEIENSSPSFDITFSANSLQDEFRIKISPENFIKVDLLIQDIVKKAEIDAEHYLLIFTDKELIDILKEPDMWSNDDYIIAQKVLEKRNICFSENELENMKEKRINKLKESVKVKKSLILLAYIFTILGGLFGIIIGWYIKNFKRTIFNGEQVFEFDKESRKKGNIIMKIAIVVHVFFLIIGIFGILFAHNF